MVTTSAGLTGRRTGTAVKPDARTTSRTGKSGNYWMILGIVSVLSITGVVMVLSASSIMSISQYGTPWHFFIRQWMWLAVGSVGFLVAVRVHHEKWRRFARFGIWPALGLLLAVLVPGIGVSAYGASRWIGTSSIQIQPSEIAKLALILFAADLLDRRADSGRLWYQIGPIVGVICLLVLLIMAQPDMGTTMVVLCIGGAMLWTSGVPVRPMAGMGGAGVVLGYIAAKAAPYRWRRMTSFLHPFKDASNTGYQSVQALLALSHGHALGDGLGSSIASYGYLPNAQTDFIFAVIGEETGLAGGAFLAALFVAFGVVGVKISCRARTHYAALVAAGITAWLVGQAVINIGAVVGLLPVTGVPLPFVSFGGSSLMIAMFGAGMLANIASES